MPNRLPPVVPPMPVVPVPGANGDVDDFQKATTGRTPVDVNAKPQQAFLTANDLIQDPDPAVGDLSHAPRLDRQGIEVVASGDMAAGLFSGGQERRPQIRGLP